MNPTDKAVAPELDAPQPRKAEMELSVERLGFTLKLMEKKVAELESKLSIARACVEHYAKKSHWFCFYDQEHDDSHCSCEQYGYRPQGNGYGHAQQTLQALEEK